MVGVNISLGRLLRWGIVVIGSSSLREENYVLPALVDIGTRRTDHDLDLLDPILLL